MAKRILATALLLLLLLSGSLWAQQEEMIAGAAASTEITKLFFDRFRHNFACAEYDFRVMTTPIRHKSGVMTTNKFIFGRIANPLAEEEKKLGKDEILLGNIPIVFVMGLETDVSDLSLNQLKQIFTGEITNWKDVGGVDAPILLVGKEETDPLLKVIKKKYPYFKNLKYDKILKYDDEAARFLNSPHGGHAIAYGAKPNFQIYNYLPVNGFSEGISVGLAYDRKNEHLPVIKAAKVYAASPEWKELLKTIDALPIN
mgnify:CR=1 FL=1